MESEKQNSGVPPGRPPPPFYPSAPPPYMDPQGGTYPMGQPGVAPPYGAPPPAYYTPPPNQTGYPPPGGYQAPQNQVPQGYPGGQSMYPDIAQLPQPQAVPLGFMPAGGHPGGPDPTQVPGAPLTGPSLVPVRPAPGPPIHSPADPALHGAPYSNQGQVSWWSNLKDGEAPPGCVISWKGGAGLKIYFLQEEGHIVSPKKSLEMSVYKKINGKGVVEENLLGMVEVLGCWRLRLHGKSSICLHTYNDTYVFLDDSTCPSKSGRIVIIELPHDVSSTMRADLLALVQEMSDTREEQEGVVGKITTNVGSVYTDITKKLNTAVKDVVPGAHKSTKWLRKGTGNLVRFGGNLVSKGMHMIADQMPAGQTEQQEEESPFHSELMEGLMKFQKAVESGSINYV